MSQPERIIRTLGQYWRLVQSLIEQWDAGSFSLHDCRQLFLQYYPDQGEDGAHLCVRSLQTSDIITQLPKSDRFTLNDGVLEFGRHLLNEHLLGSAAEIGALSTNIQKCSLKLSKAVQDRESSAINEVCRRLNNEIRKIKRQFLTNHQSILALAEQAKSNDTNLSLEQKYKQVNEAYEEYIEPMLAMLKQDGVLMETLRKTELEVSELVHQLQTSGSGVLIGDLELMERIIAGLLDFKHTSVIHLRKAAQTLFPLCEELRKNTTISRASAKLLSITRKRGIQHVFSTRPSPTISSAFKADIIGPQSGIVAYLTRIHHAPPEDHTVSVKNEKTRKSFEILSKHQVLKHAQRDSPIPDLMRWLIDNYGKQPASKQLSYFFLIKRHSREYRRIDRQTYDTDYYLIEMSSASVNDIDTRIQNMT